MLFQQLIGIVIVFGEHFQLLGGWSITFILKLVDTWCLMWLEPTNQKKLVTEKD